MPQSVEPANKPTAEYATDSLHRVGKIAPKELITRYQGFAKSYQSFEVTNEDLGLMQAIKGHQVMVFFGLWCHDSEREVARLIKLLETSHFPMDAVTLLALDTQKTLPKRYQSRYQVAFTPTIFIDKNGISVAKIVEKPELSLARDLYQQLAE